MIVRGQLRCGTFSRRYLVVGVLLTLTAAHAVRSRWLDQSTWGAGCPLGMFATVDYHDTRFYRVTWHTSHGPVGGSIPPPCAAQARRARITPTSGQVRRLALSVARHAPVREGATARRVSVQLMRVAYDSRTGSVRAVPGPAATVRVPAVGGAESLSDRRETIP